MIRLETTKKRGLLRGEDEIRREIQTREAEKEAVAMFWNLDRESVRTGWRLALRWALGEDVRRKRCMTKEVVN